MLNHERLVKTYKNYNLVELHEKLKFVQTMEAGHYSYQHKDLYIAALQEVIDHKQQIINEYITNHMIIHCQEWLDNARAKADELGVRPSLEQVLGRVASLFSSNPDAKCHLYADPHGNHREYKADFYWEWRVEGQDKALMNGGIIFHVYGDKMEWQSHT